MSRARLPHAAQTPDKGRGLEVFLGGLFQNRLVARRAGYRLAQARILAFQLLQALGLIEFEAPHSPYATDSTSPT